jgi:hypothetical protein
MAVRDGSTVRRVNHVAGSQPKERVSDHILPVDQLRHNVHQPRRRKQDLQEFRGKRKHLKKEKNNGIRKKEIH